MIKFLDLHKINERYRKEIDERIEDIIEFSELRPFIDNPVRTYSSGMYSKLAFAITAILETDIMLIDEVLSVGDEKFKENIAKAHLFFSNHHCCNSCNFFTK